MPQDTKTLLVAAATVLVLLAVLLPFARALDSRVDRQRTMYADMDRLAELEYLHTRAAGSPLPLELDAGRSVRLGGHRFTPSAGVSIRVTTTGTRYCIRAENRYHDVVADRCGDGTVDPTIQRLTPR